MTTTISLDRLEELEDNSQFLMYLEAYGVNNWEGYEAAQADYIEYLESKSDDTSRDV